MKRACTLKAAFPVLAVGVCNEPYGDKLKTTQRVLHSMHAIIGCI